MPNNDNNGTNYAVVVIAGALNLNIPVTIDPFTFSGGIISGTSTLDALQLFTWTGGQFGGGTATANGGLVIGGPATKFMVGYRLASTGSGTWGGVGNIYLQSGAVLENRGTFNATNDASIIYYGGAQSAVLNSGVFNKSSASGTGVTDIGVLFNNSGTVSVNSGVLSLSGGGTEVGVHYVTSPGGTLQLSSARTFDTASTISGSGTTVVNLKNLNQGSLITTVRLRNFPKSLPALFYRGLDR